MNKYHTEIKRTSKELNGYETIAECDFDALDDQQAQRIAGKLMEAWVKPSDWLQADLSLIHI